MPANLSPEYKSAEAAFKKAREPKERLDCLREMLRTIPKHKGTDRLQADIKTRIKSLTEELTGPKKATGRGGPTQLIRPEGAAQIALFGAPNVGKSTLHARLTGSHANAGPYPYTTQFPLPGMLSYEDIHFQLVDLPPICREHLVPWIGNAVQPANACMLVVDLGDPACVDHVVSIQELLAKKRITLLDRWEQFLTDAPASEDAISDPFAIRLPTLMIATKADEIANLQDETEVLEELVGARYPVLTVSATTGEGLDQIGPWLFEALGVVRVYTKAPGQAPNQDTPFTLRRGDTVYDVALLVHRDIADALKYARLWGSGHFNGQQVGREHPVSDGDILELHS